MERLRHSSAAFVRSMQMSSCFLHVFVEGNSDAFFYSEATRIATADTGTEWRIVRAWELSPSKAGGGKLALIGYFKYLRQKGRLFSTSIGSGHTTIFFVDKDLDDFRRSKLRNVHIHYTSLFDVENHIFEATDLIPSLAAASGLPAALVRGIIGPPQVWLESAARNWKDWVKLCAVAWQLKVSCATTFRRPSTVNGGTGGTVDQAAVEQRWAELEMAAGRGDFALTQERISHYIDLRYSDGRYHTVFKGKWYSNLLAAELLRHAADMIDAKNTLAEKIRACSLANCRFDHPAAYEFPAAIRTVLPRSNSTFRRGETP